MSDTPSSILSRAADLIRDTAAAAGPDEWTFEAFAPAVWEGDARWIALMSPAVGPMIEKWLRREAEHLAPVEHLLVRPTPALEFARAVLGEKEEQ